jgi:quinoprotein glucose dehydrogenase
VAALLKSSGENDPWIRTTAANLFAVRQLAPGTKVRLSKDIESHASAEVRMAALLSHRILADTEVSHHLSDASPALVLEAARAINDVPIPSAFPTLAALAEASKLDPLLQKFSAWKTGGSDNASTESSVAIRDVRADQPLPWGTAPIDQLTPMLLRVVNANFREGSPASAERLASLALRSDLSDLIRSEALHALGTWAAPHPRDRIVGTYRPLPARDAAPARAALERILPRLIAAESSRRAPAQETASSSSPAVSLLGAAAEAITELRLTQAAPQLGALVHNAGIPPAGRVAALRAFIRVSTDKSQVADLLKFSAADSTEAVRLEASKLNAELNPNDAAGQLAAKLASGSLAEQQSAFASLGTLKSDAADALLAEWMDKLMKREVANEVMLDLVEAAGKRNATAVKSRLEAYGKWKLPQDHLTPYRETLNGGDAARGRKIFYENAAVACTRCHHIGNDGGGNAGPVLDGLASRQPREYLLESIVFPNKQIAQGFETAMISMKNGAAYAGVLKRETDSTVVLLSPEDGEVTLKKSDIASRDKGLSGMPEGLGQQLSRQDLRDVIEFLGTLK